MSKELLKREQVKVENTWDLSALYENVEAWNQDLKWIQGQIEKLVLFQNKVVESANNLYQVLELMAQTEERLDRAYSYAERSFDQDQKNTSMQALTQKIFSVYNEYCSRTAFIVPEILAVDDDFIESAMKEENGLELYRAQLEEILRTKEHVLSAEMEELLAMAGNITKTSGDVFSVFSNADMSFPTVENEQGEAVQITHGNFVALLESPDRRVRKETFEKFYQVYKQYANSLAGLYEGQINNQIFYAKARKYGSTLEAAVDGNNVSPKVYENLVASVNANLDKMHAYVDLRKKCLAVDTLHMYDIYTPMIPDMAKKISYEEAKETILKALKPLGEDYVAKVKEGFENRWIDVYENQGKRSGAYSAGAYGAHPYVLMNYTDTLDNMFTLAHEMGHAMHSYYSNEKQPYIYSRYKIFVAEVASTCNELLLMDYLLKNTDDSKMKAYLLNHYMDSFKGTVYRQTMFAEYEMITNKMGETGESINAESLCRVYKELNEKYYGPSMCSDDEIAYEWARIPHFYYNFYVYQYATSFSASVAIAKRILEKEEGMVEKYKEFLSAGCTKAPVELLKIVDVNLEEAKPIDDALRVFGEIIKEFEALI